MIWVEVSAAFSKATQTAPKRSWPLFSLANECPTTQMCNALTMAPMPALLWYLHVRSGGLALLACAVTAQVLYGPSMAAQKLLSMAPPLLGSSIAYDTPLM